MNPSPNQIVLTSRSYGGDLLWEAWRMSVDGFRCVAAGLDVAQVLKDARMEKR